MAQGVMPAEHAGEYELEERYLYGLMAEFTDAHQIIEASRRAREAGYRDLEAYSPFPVEGLSEALDQRDMSVPWLMFIAGAVGAVGGFAFLVWTLGVDYPLNIGGRPLFAWPSYIPITFEITVLLAALTGIVSMFMLNGLPAFYHPVFDHPDFPRATSDRFFLCIEATDPRFNREETRRFLESLGPVDVDEVELKK